MEKFADLFVTLERTRSTSEKVNLIRTYFFEAAPDDAAWALFFLCGNKLKRLITGRMLFEWCQEYLNMPDWLMLESYSAVGDISETVSLLMQNHVSQRGSSLSLTEWIEGRILPLQGLEEAVTKQKIIEFWCELDEKGIFLLNKILSGSLRIGVSQLLTIQGVSQALKITKEELSQKLMGNWKPSAQFYESLLSNVTNESLSLNPYPFYLASPLVGALDELGDVSDWLAEWKWDGIRAQAIIRQNRVALWSRGNELITEQFPEIADSISKLPSGTVLDGEILAYKDGLPLAFGELQRRLGRKKVSQSMVDQVPIVFMIYDILEYEGSDIRKNELINRRNIFEKWEVDRRIQISPIINFQSWEELVTKREEAKLNRTEGLIIKRKNSAYGVGRRRGNWWKYKIDPKTIDVILMYAQPGHGWRANLYTDYTFGVWHNDELVPIAKAYSGLNQEEIFELDQWIRRNTVEKFGPVRKVKSGQVFEIAFEGIQKSGRHKSGVALRFPRISRWRKDKPIEECDSLDSVKREFLL